jgi:hypothetical protein
MKWHEHRPKKVTKTNSDKHEMKKWNDINLSQQKVGKIKSGKTGVTRNIEVGWKMHT